MTTFLQKVGAFFEGVLKTEPSAADAVTKLKSAASAVDTVLPTLANAAVNAALGFIPFGLGAELDPVADNLIDKVIAGLTAKKSTAAQPTATPATPTSANDPLPSPANVPTGIEPGLVAQ